MRPRTAAQPMSHHRAAWQLACAVPRDAGRAFGRPPALRRAPGQRRGSYERRAASSEGAPCRAARAGRAWQLAAGCAGRAASGGVVVAEDWPQRARQKFRQRKIREKVCSPPWPPPALWAELGPLLQLDETCGQGCARCCSQMICAQHQIMAKRPTSRGVAVGLPREAHRSRRSAGGTTVTTRRRAGG